MSEPWDVVLLGHGSRRGSDTDEGLKDAVGRLQALAGTGVRVRMAAFEFTRPSIPEAIEMLEAEGSRRIAIVPFFLFDGKHVTIEIPEELESVRSRFPALEVQLGRTLGVDSRLVELVAERVQEADSSADGVILVNRGTRRQYEEGERLREVAGLVQQRLGVRVAPAQAEYESPTIVEAAATLAAAGLKRVVVVPYIFFPGKVLKVNILPAVEEAAKRSPGVSFRVSRTLGVDDRVIELAWERAREVMG